MLSLPRAIQIFVATAPTNMHLSVDRLAALARDVLQQGPLSGHLFAFFTQNATPACKSSTGIAPVSVCGTSGSSGFPPTSGSRMPWSMAPWSRSSSGVMFDFFRDLQDQRGITPHVP